MLAILHLQISTIRYNETCSESLIKFHREKRRHQLHEKYTLRAPEETTQSPINTTKVGKETNQYNIFNHRPTWTQNELQLNLKIYQMRENYETFEIISTSRINYSLWWTGYVC